MQNRVEAGNNHWIRSRRIGEKDCFLIYLQRDALTVLFAQSYKNNDR